MFFLFGIILTMGIYRYRIIHSPIYTNLQGTYKIELDSSHVYRSFDVYPYGFLVHIHKDNIRLPTFKRKNSNTQFTSQDLDILKKENNGSWKIISSNPDSIYIYMQINMCCMENIKCHLKHTKQEILDIQQQIIYT